MGAYHPDLQSLTPLDPDMTYGTFPGPIFDVKSELLDYQIVRLLICQKCWIGKFEWLDPQILRFSELLDSMAVGLLKLAELLDY